MRVVIAGGHGKIALLLERLLAARGARRFRFNVLSGVPRGHQHDQFRRGLGSLAVSRLEGGVHTGG